MRLISKGRWFLLGAAAGAAGLLALYGARSGNAAQTPPGSPGAAPRSGFKLTFGLNRKNAGANWSGSLRNPAQARGIAGWHLGAGDSLTQPASWQITAARVGVTIPARAVILDLATPEEQPVAVTTRSGDFTFVPASLPYGKILAVEGFNGDVTVERVPLANGAVTGPAEEDDPALLRARDGTYWLAWVAYRTRARKGFQIDGADEVMVASSRDGRTWSAPQAVTPPGDHFRVALAEDAGGRLWCVYALQKRMESGNFDLYARSFDGKRWSGEEQLTTSPMPDTFHRVASDAKGNIYVVWMGFRPGPNQRPAQSDILMRVRTGRGWGPEMNVSASPEDDWEPAVAAANGRAWVAWDSYRTGGNPVATYDVLLRGYDGNRLGPVTTVSATAFAEMRADVAVDASDRVWVAWEEDDVNWGKDDGYGNPRHRINLRKGGSRLYGPPMSNTAFYRRPRVAIVENGRLMEPQAELEKVYSQFMPSQLYQSPRLGLDGTGAVWLLVRHQMVQHGFTGGHMFDFYATTLTGPRAGQSWLTPVLVPGSTGRQDTVLATAPGARRQIVIASVTDGRRFPESLPVNHDISVTTMDGGGIAATAPALAAFQPSAAPSTPPTHPREAEQVKRVQAYRVRAAGKSYKILRGDVHRHTEISGDGAIDGSLWDAYRYAINAASFDFLAVTDHNYGAWLFTDRPGAKDTDDVYQWWRTQKSADIFYVPGRFIALYGYERSINFPLGHRNIIHARRGIFSLRVPQLQIAERPELIDGDARNLWDYLRSTDGIGIPHTSGTGMGTDWKRRNDELEPVTEIYQGDRNSYEEEGAPRAATKDYAGPGNAGKQPYQKGLIWNALGVGYRMGFIASSDHFNTHTSYANLLVPEGATTRADVQEAFRKRRTYGSTDNIIVDFHTPDTLQGGDLTASQSPTFQVEVIGTEPILKVELIKNNRVIYTHPTGTGQERVAFSFRDNAGGGFQDTTMYPSSQIKDWSNPETGIRPRPSNSESYYYVRVIQSYSTAEPAKEGEIAWSSPIFVTVKK